MIKILKYILVTFLSLVQIIFLFVMFYAYTFIGKLFLLIPIMIVLILQIFLFCNNDNKKKNIIMFIICLIFIDILIIIINVPESENKNSIISSEHYNLDEQSKYSMFNIIPESEQFNFGFLIMAKLDRLLTIQQAKYAKEVTFKIYDELEKDVDFKDLPSVMGLAYSEFFTGNTDYGHYYKMSDKNSIEKKKPLMIFLHGSLGNFKGYMWVLSKLVKDYDLVIVAPSYGSGNWHIGNSDKVINEVVKDVMTKENIDKDKIYLCGISNGGIGVSIFSYLNSELISKIILLSPVMPKLFLTSDYSLKMQNVEFIIISGNKDRRIPPNYIQNRYKGMLDNNLNVNLNILDDSDHFMFFAEPDSVINIIENWINKNDDFH